MQHIGFIMDGNRRFAKKLSQLVSFWHEKWGDNVEAVLTLCLDAGIPYVSMWALSKENILERSENEIQAIFTLLETKIPKLVPKLIKSGIKLEIVWDLWLVPSSVREVLFEAMEQTAWCNTMTFILALWYSGQDEIIRGIKRLVAEGIDIKTLTEKDFLQYIDTGKYPPPDIIVRTGWAIRHSGFFLYQSAYSEYYFTDTLWPDFGKKDFDAVIAYLHTVKRNFGK